MEMYDLSSWNVVIVDDEPDNLEVLSEALLMFDVKIRTALEGQEAVKLIEADHPTLIITDLSMPGIDGYQLLYKIRHMAGMETIPVIALTAHAMAGDKERILSSGFSGYMSKPVRIANLLTDIFQIAPSLKPAPATQGETK
jgi:CheY-like chemotaxis protein